jgi:hypothetical protein
MPRKLDPGVYERIEHELLTTDLKLTEIAAKLGVKISTVRGISSGHIQRRPPQKPGPKTAEELAKPQSWNACLRCGRPLPCVRCAALKWMHENKQKHRRPDDGLSSTIEFDLKPGDEKRRRKMRKRELSQKMRCKLACEREQKDTPAEDAA